MFALTWLVVRRPAVARCGGFVITAWLVLALGARVAAALPSLAHSAPIPHEEPATSSSAGPAVPATCWPVHVQQGPYVSVQVNVDANGMNIIGDAANEPSIAVDPNDPNKIVIGWRQFDSVESDFREAGVAYSHDGGVTWTNLGELTDGVFGSDPVLAADVDGVFYYLSINFDDMRLFKSYDSGVTWDDPIIVAPEFRDKPWMAIDTTDGIGRGNIYVAWLGNFQRSTDSGNSWSDVVDAQAYLGNVTVGPHGDVYVVDGTLDIGRSSNAHDPAMEPYFEDLAGPSLDGGLASSGDPNPGGLMGPGWLIANPSVTDDRDQLFLLATIERSSDAPTDVVFARSDDSGLTWTEPELVHEDLYDESWQWFGTLSVGPDGRLHACWYDTRNSDSPDHSQLYYSYSNDHGNYWAPSIALTPSFNTLIGWPAQDKIGDYIGMLTTDVTTHIAYSATFNGEQDIWTVSVSIDCNGNGMPDLDDVYSGGSDDCSGNRIPDECETDFDGDGDIDLCDSDSDDDGLLNEDDDCDFTPLDSPINRLGRPAGDWTGDCLVTLEDHTRLPGCLGGPAVPAATACADWFDHDFDEDVDLRDVGAMHRAFTGP